MDDKILQQLIATFSESQKELINAMSKGQNDILMERQHIKVENLRPFDIGVRETKEHPQGLIIEGGGISSEMTLDEIKRIVDKGESTLVGVDGIGTHAPLRICDFEIYKTAFNLPDAKDYPLQLTYSEILKLLKIKEIDKFNKRMSELIHYDSERRTLIHTLWRDDLTKDLLGWQIKAIEDYTHSKIDF